MLKSHPFIRFDRISPTGAKVEQTLRRMRIKPKKILKVNSVAAIIDLVRQNVGISIVPLFKHVAWTRDHSLIALQLPYGPLKRVIGILENDRQLDITAVVRQKLLQVLA
ncbi:LysR substrate-binding domain-containing protein [Caballeronia sp. dw_19]|uniref:LysR substrate-binding domain-containing protein n=1 Tax=Caballeronia sp. dw_19 TaxID=2719791 RepID=UPI001BD5EB24|nr:LysR substrate-binding domain-containing protein [Caballeronia sp. dw_19]